MPNKIPDQDLEKTFETLKGWHLGEDRKTLHKKFILKDFKAAWALMTEIADYAEDINHHPKWFNVYNRLDITLTTHDVDGLSDLDLKMAQKIDLLTTGICK